ncbi:M23 family metallopeptidase [Clostridium sp. MSJ-11]|uniref:M23 family metallopeptidase n=1 Tax=Clostridium mobile TaxID=2841512 RepID=A0ABS6EMB1_9CLOT|nr:M23 family metallopeptidase [Clostridium mobile]MBU5486363.1 M23 family metallopeptidase [Clostridium mobile]
MRVKNRKSFIVLLISMTTLFSIIIMNNKLYINKSVQSNKKVEEEIVMKEAIVVKSDGVKVALLNSEDDIKKMLNIIREESIKNSEFKNIKEVILNNSITYYKDIVNADEVREPEYFAYNIMNGHDEIWDVSFTIKGENIKDSNPVLSRGTVSSNFGMRWGRMHNGVDIAAPSGTPIHAILPGKVIYSGWENGYGNVVRIDNGDDTVTIYGHCSKLFAQKGEYVKVGDKIAEVGSTGRSTGPHLHFEVRIKGVPQDPTEYIN